MLVAGCHTGGAFGGGLALTGEGSAHRQQVRQRLGNQITRQLAYQACPAAYLNKIKEMFLAVAWQQEEDMSQEQDDWAQKLLA